MSSRSRERRGAKHNTRAAARLAALPARCKARHGHCVALFSAAPRPEPTGFLIPAGSTAAPGLPCPARPIEFGFGPRCRFSFQALSGASRSDPQPPEQRRVLLLHHHQKTRVGMCRPPEQVPAPLTAQGCSSRGKNCCRGFSFDSRPPRQDPLSAGAIWGTPAPCCQAPRPEGPAPPPAASICFPEHGHDVRAWG